MCFDSIYMGTKAVFVDTFYSYFKYFEENCFLFLRHILNTCLFFPTPYRVFRGLEIFFACYQIYSLFVRKSCTLMNVSRSSCEVRKELSIYNKCFKSTLIPLQNLGSQGGLTCSSGEKSAILACFTAFIRAKFRVGPLKKQYENL